jgi:membrane-associated phospholipid phosphatase
MAAVLALLSAMYGVDGHAGSVSARGVLEDTKLYFTAPLRWDTADWSYFGASLVVIGAAHQFDDDVRRHFVAGKRAQAAGQDGRSTADAIPGAVLLGGTLAAAWLTQDRAGYSESWSMLEAGALSGVTAFALKSAVGRARPNDTDDANDWSAGGDSFPSMHTTVAFAIGTVLAESGNDRYRWLRRTLGYGVAGGTAYLRLRGNVHWLSDTVAGASLGLATAQFVMHRRDDERRHRHGSLQVVPVEDGLMLTYSAALH